MLKKLLLICVVIFCTLTPVYAAGGIDCRINSQTGELTVNVSGFSGIVTLEVYKPGKTKDDLAQNTLKDVLFAVKETTAEDNSAQFSLLLTESDESGNYTVIAAAGGESVSDTFYFSTKAERDKALENISNAEGNIDEVLKNNNHIFQLDLSGDYEKYRSKVCAAFEDIREQLYKGRFEDVNQVHEAFEKAVAYGALNGADLSEMIEITDKYAKILGIEVEPKKEVFAAALINVRNEMTDKVFTVSNTEDALLYAKALYSVNTSNRVDMTSVLETYKDVLSLDLSKYDTVDKIEANKALTDKNFANKKEISDALDAKIESLLNPGGSGGRGNKSSGGGSGGTSARYDVSNDYITDEPKNYFDDLSDAEWARDAINYLAEKNIVNGVEPRKFMPNENVTREEFIKILSEVFGWNVAAEHNFSDVENGSWYEKYVSYAYNKGIVNGYDGKFGVGQSVTREDIAAFLYRAAALENIDLKAVRESALSDENQISDYAKEPVKALCDAGIINGYGDGSFKPKAYCTRAEICRLIYNTVCQKEVN